MRRGSTIASIIIAGIGVIALVDVLRNPTGTMAAGSAASDFAVPAYSALLGTAPGYAPSRNVPK